MDNKRFSSLPDEDGNYIAVNITPEGIIVDLWGKDDMDGSLMGCGQTWAELELDVKDDPACLPDEFQNDLALDVFQGDDELALDDFVIDTCLKTASDTNNLGIESQIQFLITNWGAEKAFEMVRDVIKEIEVRNYPEGLDLTKGSKDG